MKVVWLGWHQLKDALAALPGVQVAFASVPKAPQDRPWTWVDAETLAVETWGAGTRPDLFVYADQSLPPPVVGVESFPCATLFFCVDSHIHSWYPAWARGFDLCTVSLKDHLPVFAAYGRDAQTAWMPPTPKPLDLPPETPLPDAKRRWDLLFVGHVDPATTPVRQRFLSDLKTAFPGLHVTQGAYRELFPQARLVLNIAERGDLNFRVFEALACGACLLTPEVGHGFTDLFTPGEHLFSYPPDDIPALTALARELLADPVRREEVARAGCELVQRKHSVAARAAQLLAWIAEHDLAALATMRLARAAMLRKQLRLVYLHWAEALSGTEQARAYLRAYGRSDLPSHPPSG